MQRPLCFDHIRLPGREGSDRPVYTHPYGGQGFHDWHGSGAQTKGKGLEFRAPGPGLSVSVRVHNLGLVFRVSVGD